MPDETTIKNMLGDVGDHKALGDPSDVTMSNVVGSGKQTHHSTSSGTL